MKIDPLTILELSPGNTLEDAKKSYHKLSLLCHPDKNPNDPKASENFRILTDAINLINKNPSILNPKINKTNSGFIHTSIDVSLEDVYFSRVKYINLKNKDLCGDCSGTGSSLNLEGVCAHCDGNGVIKSKILEMMNRSSVCPVCKGTGIKPGTICKLCKGERVVEKIINIKIKLDIKHFYYPTEVFKNIGNQKKDGTRGDIHIKINILPTEGAKIDSWVFSTIKKISPVQHIIGDTDFIHAFGRKIPINILPGETSTETTDIVELKKLNRKWYIKYVIETPALNPETKNLYKKILELEKGNQDE